MSTRTFFQVIGACAAGGGLLLMCGLAVAVGAAMERLQLWPW